MKPSNIKFIKPYINDAKVKQYIKNIKSNTVPEMQERDTIKLAKQVWEFGDFYGSAAVQDALRRAGLNWVVDNGLTPKQFDQLRLAGLMDLLKASGELG